MVGRKLQGEEKAAVLAEFAKRGMTGDPPPPPCVHYRGLRQDRDGLPITIKCGCDGEERDLVLPVGTCAKLGRCLPSWRPSESQRESWGSRPESQMFSICCGCGDYEPIPDP